MSEQISYTSSKAIDMIVIERLKTDLTDMLSEGRAQWEETDDLSAVAGVLKYYMPKQDYENFIQSVGYTVGQENVIHCVDVKDNPDGSADVTFTFTGDKMKQTLIEEGLNYLIMKGAFQLSTDDVARLVQRGMKEEETDRVLGF
jgi:tRNA U38,U39,U40 pseudouridine synthase TruA